MVQGYEIHVRNTKTAKGSNLQSLITLEKSQKDGVIDECNQVLGTYLHGIFDSIVSTQLISLWVGACSIRRHDHLAARKYAIDRITDCVKTHLSLDFI
ncbi:MULTISPECIES: hypothetical protein [Vibrio]|uniref:CobB/CobQ-like glutamine amidotransferase domain-containing protein n=2 Tax=Vibrio TaxID=662 RepID=A0A7X4RVW3_9VIBR|nr:hypothetical protein [Vibrio nitrifigilis]MZI94554.1 hypothetical protein [Vibrio eleionomae]